MFFMFSHELKMKMYIIPVLALLPGFAFGTGMNASQCAQQVDKILTQFDKAVAANVTVEGGVITYGTTKTPITEKYDPCQDDTTFDPAVVTTVTGWAWASSSQWAWKYAEKFEFLTKQGGKYVKNGDVVIIDTQSGFHNIKCADGRVYYSNWLQWVTGDAVSLTQCSTLGKEIDCETSWCTLLHCNDTYCTFPSHIDTARDLATASGVTCTD